MCTGTRNVESTSQWEKNIVVVVTDQYVLMTAKSSLNVSTAAKRDTTTDARKIIFHAFGVVFPRPTNHMLDSGDGANDAVIIDLEVGGNAPTVTIGLARDATQNNVGHLGWTKHNVLNATPALNDTKG